jgi:hypothetical protein
MGVRTVPEAGALAVRLLPQPRFTVQIRPHSLTAEIHLLFLVTNWPAAVQVGQQEHMFPVVVVKLGEATSQ